VVDTPGRRSYRLLCHAYSIKAGARRVLPLGNRSLCRQSLRLPCMTQRFQDLYTSVLRSLIKMKSVRSLAVSSLLARRTGTRSSRGSPSLCCSSVGRLCQRHRAGDRQVEWHETQADVFFVLSGTATLLLGGKMVNGETVGPHEKRNGSIVGGIRQPLAAGDVVRIRPAYRIRCC